jgi:hypothetical protein
METFGLFLRHAFPSKTMDLLTLLLSPLSQDLGILVQLHPLLDHRLLYPAVVRSFLALRQVLHSRHHRRRECAVLGFTSLCLSSRLYVPQDVGVSRLDMIIAIESARDGGTVVVNVTHDSWLLVGFCRHAHKVLCCELLGVGVFCSLLHRHLISCGVVFGNLLLSADFLVRFEMRLLALTVAIGDGFAAVAGLEGLICGAWFVAVGTCVGSHDDAAERREVIVSVGLV